ncbi:hypothetical protein [Geodermatophilus sp. CPCC 206100]|uniref:hypothetical protein n=1 Tax=Geodermatophilus sp. CPCC 206100 TaxID=3020054 RepID=UPI003B00E079
MNRWVQRGLRTALLTGGLLAAGAGVAAADENDVTADLLGVTTTVPEQDGAVVGTPVVTGTGTDLTIGEDLVLPVDTNTVPGTTVLGDGGVSVPVRVTEADDSPPDPADGLTVTVPVNTSGGGTAGTTVTAPVVTGDLGGVLDGDPLTGDSVAVDLVDPVVPGPGGEGLLLDLEDTVRIGDTDGTTSPDTVLDLPVGLDPERATTVALPLPGAPGSAGGPVTDEDVDVTVGGLLGTGSTGSTGGEQPADAEPLLSLPIDTGYLLPGLLGGDALRDDTVDVDLGGLLGGGAGRGSVVTVPVNEGGTGTGSDVLVRVTLPIDLAGLPGRDGTGPDAGEPGTPGGTGGDGQPGTGPGTTVPVLPGAPGGTAPGTGADGTGTGGTAAGGNGTAAAGDGTGTNGSALPGDCTDGGPAPAGTGGAPAADGPDTGGPAASGSPGNGPGTGLPSTDACGTGVPQADVAYRASATGAAGAPVALTAGALAVAAGLLMAAGRGRLWRDRA